MLEQLIVKNFALIDQASIDFDSGLNIISGETGAGKSIFIGALNLLFGAKGSKDSVRTGADEAQVSAVVNVAENRDALDWLQEHGIEPEDDTVIIRRTHKTTGRGNVFIQSVPVTRMDLEAFSSLLFDLHGQHQHQSLLNHPAQRRILDRFGGLEDVVAEFQELFQQYTAKKERLNAQAVSEQERTREIEILQFAIDEIHAADLKPGEEEELQKEKRILSQYEKLFGHIQSFEQVMSAGGGDVITGLRQARTELSALAQVDDAFKSLEERLDSVYYEVEDVAQNVTSYFGDMSYDSGRVEIVEDRLHRIFRLEQKYGADIPAVLAYGEEAQEKLEALVNWSADQGKLKNEVAELEQRVITLAGQISLRRKEIAAGLQSSIEEGLHPLGMANVEFRVQVTPKLSENGKPVCTPGGMDLVQFLISPNKGEPLKELRRIASGGELSRVMLALKTILADQDLIGTLVFDEIDAGIGGEIGKAVGVQLAKIAHSRQIICITHLASIAVRADKHIKVEKSDASERTVTSIFEINGEGRTREIARMLSGESDGEASLQHAADLLERYKIGDDTPPKGSLF